MSPMMQRYMKSQTTSTAQDSAFAIGTRNQARSRSRHLYAYLEPV